MFDFLKKPCVRNRDNFAASLKKNGIRYQINKKDCSVDIAIPTPNCEDLEVSFIFNNDGKTVTVFALSLKTFSPEKLPAAYRLCNKLNSDSVWLRFCIDEERCELDGEMSMITGGKNTGDHCFALLSQVVPEADEACGEFKL